MHKNAEGIDLRETPFRAAQTWTANVTYKKTNLDLKLSIERLVMCI